MARRPVANEAVTSGGLTDMINYRSAVLNASSLATIAGNKTATVNVGYLAIPATDYASVIDVDGSFWCELGATADWSVRFGYDTAADPGATGTGTPGATLQRDYLHNPFGTPVKRTANVSGKFTLAANTAAWIRMLAVRTAGTLTIGTPIGLVLNAHRTEIFPAA